MSETSLESTRTSVGEHWSNWPTAHFAISKKAAVTKANPIMLIAGYHQGIDGTSNAVGTESEESPDPIKTNAKAIVTAIESGAPMAPITMQKRVLRSFFQANEINSNIANKPMTAGIATARVNAGDGSEGTPPGVLGGPSKKGPSTIIASALSNSAMTVEIAAATERIATVIHRADASPVTEQLGMTLCETS